MLPHHTLEAWKEARAVSRLVLIISKEFWRPWAGALFEQIQRASLSVQLNIAEGHSFGERPSYFRHLGIAYGSAVETGEIIDLLINGEVIPPDVGATLQAHSGRSQRLLVGLLKRRRSFATKKE